MSEPRHRLRVLHISDLHERGPREAERWRRYRVLGDAWERNLAELLQDGPIDLVCFTGDAADWGPLDIVVARASFKLSCRLSSLTARLSSSRASFPRLSPRIQACSPDLQP